MAAMTLFGASRFTAILAAIAIAGTAGTFWWAIEIRADLKSGASNRSPDHSSPSKPAGRALHLKDERSNKFELMGRSERQQPGPPPWGEDRDQFAERTAPPLVSVNYTPMGSQNGAADMPLPIPPVGSDREPSQGKTPEPPAFALPLPPENPKRQTREPRSDIRPDLRPDPGPEPAVVAAPRLPKLPSRSYYMEKVVEQGDAGEVKFRYRRQSCEPPNMPDVCFMPQANRRGIVVERR
jgi:hypothetical protein